MRVIISPTKLMEPEEYIAAKQLPLLIEESEQIAAHMRQLSWHDLHHYYRTNEQITSLNYERWQQMNMKESLSPALFTYSGLQFQSMQPDILTQDQWDYLEEHLRILSAFYGLLRPFDGIKPYRLDFVRAMPIDEAPNLYAYWGRRVYDALDTEGPILNLASKEYSKLISPYVSHEDHMIDFEFYRQRQDSQEWYQPATLAKQTRGALVRYMAEHHVEQPEALHQFNDLSMQFDEEHSTARLYILREKRQ